MRNKTANRLMMGAGVLMAFAGVIFAFLKVYLYAARKFYSSKFDSFLKHSINTVFFN